VKARILVLRLHSLGDVVLTTGIVRALAESAEVDVVTDAAHRAVFHGHPGVARLWTREELGCASLDLRYDGVYDLQNTPGSRRLAARLGPVRAARHRAAARRWVVLWGDRRPRPRIPHALARYAEACGLAPERVAPSMWVTAEEEAEAGGLVPEIFSRTCPGKASGAAPLVAVLTGASRKSKEAPPETLLRAGAILRARGARIAWVVPPNREPHPAWGSLGPVLRLPLGPLKAVLARADLAIANDSGPMHVAEALGIRVLTLFGSSVPAFGFAPSGAWDRVLAVEDLPCRPCGVHGRNACWLGHWRCLALAPERIAEEAAAILAQARPQREGVAAPAPAPGGNPLGGDRHGV
jgi:ADP-heptose:LPS heptosyltransferase